MSEPREIDFGQIEFPSDRISLKHLRARATNARCCISQLVAEYGETLDSMRFLEEDVASLAFARATGEQEELALAIALCTGFRCEARDGPVDELREIRQKRNRLAECYARLGLVDGVETGRLLVSQVEDQAARQARQNALPTPVPA